MKNPRASAHEAPATPNAAVVINAGAYFGASGLRKMLLLTRPMRFASGTPIEVRSTPTVSRLVSSRRPERGHHETRIICELDLSFDIVNGSVDDEADEREHETQGDEWEPKSSPIREEGEDEKHGSTADVRGHCVEVRLDGAVSQALHDLGHEETDALERDAKADLDGEEAELFGSELARVFFSEGQSERTGRRGRCLPLSDA
ncbi:hypothetical protein CaCOL14_010466 [Colletotrichum acutatum]